MSTINHVQKVQEMYAAFGRGDVPFILNALAADVAWTVDGPSSVPLFGDRRGKDAVAQFFQAIGTHLDIQEFTPQQFFAQGESVVVLGFERGRVRSTGRSYEGHWAHVFTFRGTSVSSFREYSNTAAIAEAFQSSSRSAAA